MKLTAKITLTVLAWALFTLLLLMPVAHAAEPSRCGALATGKVIASDDKAITGAFPRQFVGPDGLWHYCQPWVPDGGDPMAPEPPPELYCNARDTYEVWEVDGLQCSSIPPGFSTSTTMMLPRTKAGRVALIRAEWGPTRGMLVMRCTPRPNGTAEWRVDGSTCAYRE